MAERQDVGAHREPPRREADSIAQPHPARSHKGSPFLRRRVEFGRLLVSARGCQSPNASLSTSASRYAACRTRCSASGRYSSRSEEHTSELQSLMRNSYAVFCLKHKKPQKYTQYIPQNKI